MKRLLTRLLRPGRDAAPAPPAAVEDAASPTAPDHSARVVSIHAGTATAERPGATGAEGASRLGEGDIAQPAPAADPVTRAAPGAAAPGVATPSPATETALASPAASGAPQAVTPALPAGLDAADVPERRTRRRSALRRRLRFLRRARDVRLRDLGGLVYEAHRSGATADELVRSKVERLTRVDAEIAALSAALGERERSLVVREPAIGGECAACGEIFGSSARFCSSCGADVTTQTSAVVDAAAVAPDAVTGERAHAAGTATAQPAATRIGDRPAAGAPAPSAPAAQAATAIPVAGTGAATATPGVGADAAITTRGAGADAAPATADAADRTAIYRRPAADAAEARIDLGVQARPPEPSESGAASRPATEPVLTPDRSRGVTPPASADVGARSDDGGAQRASSGAPADGDAPRGDAAGVGPTTSGPDEPRTEVLPSATPAQATDVEPRRPAAEHAPPDAPRDDTASPAPADAPRDDAATPAPGAPPNEHDATPPSDEAQTQVMPTPKPRR